MKVRKLNDTWFDMIPETEDDQYFINFFLLEKGVKECDLEKDFLKCRIRFFDRYKEFYNRFGPGGEIEVEEGIYKDQRNGGELRIGTDGEVNACVMVPKPKTVAPKISTKPRWSVEEIDEWIQNTEMGPEPSPKLEKVNQDEPNPKNGLEELMEMIENGEVVPEDKEVPFYDKNGRPLHFVKPKQEKEA